MCGTAGGRKDLTYWLMWVSRSSGDPLLFRNDTTCSWVAEVTAEKKPLTSSRREQHERHMCLERSSDSVIWKGGG